MAAQFQFVMRSGPMPGATYPLEGDQLTIGRDSNNGVAINDATPDMVRSYVKDHQLGILVGYAPREQATAYLGLSVLERLAVPQVMIIDRQGVVQAQSDAQGAPDLQNEANLRGLIGNLLKK